MSYAINYLCDIQSKIRRIGVDSADIKTRLLTFINIEWL